MTWEDPDLWPVVRSHAFWTMPLIPPALTGLLQLAEVATTGMTVATLWQQS